MKKIIAMVLCFIFVVSLAGVSVAAELGDEKTIENQQSEKEVLKLQFLPILELEPTEPTVKNVNIKYTNLEEVYNERYSDNIELQVFAKYINNTFGISLNSSWKVTVHYYDTEKTTGMVKFLYHIGSVENGEIGTNKSILFTLNNGKADMVYYSCLDCDTNEEDLLRRVYSFKSKYEQEQYKLKDGEVFESSTIDYTYNYDTEKLIYCYTVFFSYDGLINNDYGTACLIDGQGNAVQPNSTNPTDPTKPTPPTKPVNPAKLKVVRMGGSDRYYTSIIISDRGWDKADTVIIASGESYPDALAGAVLAKKENAPILLTGKNSITANTLAQISKLGAKNVIILGGTVAVSENIENGLISSGLNVDRIAGENRNDTAKQIARRVSKSKQTVFLVSNANFADALSASSVAAIKECPILFLNADGSIPAETEDAIKVLLSENAYIIGGFAAIGENAENNLAALGITTERVYGKDRYATSVEIYDKFKSIFISKEAAIATGRNFPDALSGGAFAAIKGMPIFLVGDTATDALMARVAASSAENVFILGGEMVISESIVNNLTA